MKKAKKVQRRRKRQQHQKRRAHRCRSSRTLRRSIFKFLPQDIFAGLKLHGNTSWDLFPLALIALFWAWSNESTLGDRWQFARQISQAWLPDAYFSTSYPGFINALATHRETLVNLIATHLRTLMLSGARAWILVAGYLAFAVDGSKVEAPWTAANEQALGMAGRKPRGKCQREETNLRPQLMVTLVWVLGLQVPWAWKHGGLEEGERSQFRSLLELLPVGALIVADAGFIGYDFWRSIIDNGRHLLIRVGANVRVLQTLYPGSTVERQGDIVYVWPKDKQDQNEPPLRLRLIRLSEGRKRMYLVTSILDPDRLTEEQASELYHRRWTIEGGFRSFKQTMERRKMRSHTPEHAACELDFGLLSLWLLGLLAKGELLAADQSPDRMSVVQSLRMLRQALKEPDKGMYFYPGNFRRAVLDRYIRCSSKKARHNARKKRPKPPGEPKIRPASPTERQRAKGFSAHFAAGP